MVIRIAAIDKRTFHDLFPGCKTCVYWENPGEFGSISSEEAEKQKSAWFETTVALSNPCGKLLYVDDEPAAYCQFAPPERVPGIPGYEDLAAHLNPESIFVSCLVVREGYQGKGIGRMLLQDVIEELKSRGCKAIETFARDDSDNNCSGPTRFYLNQGFKVVASKTFPQGTFSLMQMDL